MKRRGKIRNFYQSLKFRNKLIVICILTILLPLALNTLTFYHFSVTIMENRTYDYLQNLAAVTMSKIEMSVENVENTAFFIAGNETLQQILGQPRKEERSAAYRQYHEAKDLLSYYVLLSGEISSIHIYAKDGRTFSYTKTNQALPSQEIQKEEEQWVCLNGHIYLQRTLYHFQDQTVLGKMITEINAPVFYDIVKDISYDTDSEVYIVDRENNIITCQNSELTGEKLSKDFSEAVSSGEEQNRIILEGENYVAYTGSEIQNGWRMVLALPEDYFIRNIEKFRDFIFGLTFLTGVIAFFLIILSSYRITKPLKSLSKAMEKVGQGDFQVNCPIEGGDEIAALGDSFNQMVRDMGTLIDSVYEQKMLKQQAEMKSLQMQINPHFLYNTLDTMNWIARIRGVNEVGYMAAALGNLMRYSLSENDFVTIEEELRQLKSYIEIQNVRYGDRMTIVFEIEERTKEYYIPKLLVQPILENAIVHGVENKLEPATIEIKIYAQGDDLYLTVEDDGVGMTQEAIESLMDMDYTASEQRHTSIGVCNVNRRIQAVFGAACGLQVQSQLGAGTKITLHLKILKERPDIRLKYNE